MIIGISGKKQHGKDTVAKIIQWLTVDHSDRPDLDSLEDKTNLLLKYINKDISLGTRATWSTKQFAAKLKQVVALLIGCTLEQLEDNEFKETPLGEQWRVWYWTHYKWPMKRISKLCMSEQEAQELLVDYKTVVEYFGIDSRLESEVLTPRKLLQIVGTECGRELIHPNIWVNALMADYRLETKFTPSIVEPSWIITDVRFPNEVKAIEDRGGVVVRVNRTNFQNPPLVDNHSSEISLDNWEFMYTITNNGSIEHLVDQVKNILKLIPYASKTEREEDSSKRSSR